MGNESKTACLHSIVAALVGAEEKLGADREWIPGAPIEERMKFLQDYFPGCKEDIVELGEEIIKSLASDDYNELNKFLIKNGFVGRFTPLEDEELGLVGILDLLVEWMERGEVAEIITDGQSYPAVRMKKGVGIWRLAGALEPVVCITTKQGYDVYMTICECPSGGVMEMVSLAKELQDSIPYSELHPDFDRVRFPMVSINQFVTLPWLEGIETYDDKGTLWTIMRAIQQNKLRMNEFGARAQSATSTMTASNLAEKLLKQELVIDRPFLIWFSEPGMEFPLFAAHVGYDDWKDPGDITVA